MGIQSGGQRWVKSVPYTRMYQPGDEEEILKLFQIVYGKSLAPEYWKWRFFDNPVARPMINLVFDGDTLVSHYAVSPVNLRMADDLCLGALSMTTMTHPDYTGQGYFKKLAQELYEYEVSKSDLALVYGFPNLNSHYAFHTRLGWSNIARIPMLKIFWNGVDENPSGIIETDIFQKRHFEISYEISRQFCFKLERNAAYLNWRYVQNPSIKYRIFEDENSGEYVVASLYQDIINIVELNCFCEKRMRTLFDAAIFRMNDGYAGILNTWIPMNDRRHVLLERMGFVFDSPITWMGARFFGVSEGSFYYSMGDSDVF